MVESAATGSSSAGFLAASVSVSIPEYATPVIPSGILQIFEIVLWKSPPFLDDVPFAVVADPLVIFPSTSEASWATLEKKIEK